MRAFILICSSALVLALGFELFSLRPALMSEPMLTQPTPQQLAWIVICVLSPLLLAAAVLLGERLVRQRKATEQLEARLRGVGDTVAGLAEAQNDGDAAADYLARTDPEGAISTLQGRVAKVEQAANLHHGRNQAADLLSQVERLRLQQSLVREKLADVIANRRSVEAIFAELQSSQDDIERTLAVIEEDKNRDTLAERLQKISAFVAGTGSRFEDIERSLRELLRMKGEFGALQTRLAPLEDKETGVNGVLRSLQETRERMTASIDRIDNVEGTKLETRVEQLAQTNKQLEEQVSGLLAQFSKLDTMHKDICGLFAKLNYAQNVPRGLEQGVRLISTNG